MWLNVYAVVFEVFFFYSKKKIFLKLSLKQCSNSEKSAQTGVSVTGVKGTMQFA